MDGPETARDGEIEGLETAADVSAALERIYGAPPVATGVIHPTAVWDGEEGRLVTLEINDRTPRSAHDFFLLNAARARADAILTTGKILREEPELEHRLQGPERVPEALAAWRAQTLGKQQPPVTLVLSSGRDLDLEHPLFRSWTRPVVYTSREGQWRLESRAADCGVELAGVDLPTARGAVEFLRRSFGAATVSIEAGPSVSRRLYRDPPVVDELLLSVFHAPALDKAVRGAEFLPRRRIEGLFGGGSPPYRVATGDGEWRFRRFTRF